VLKVRNSRAQSIDFIDNGNIHKHRRIREGVNGGKISQRTRYQV